MTNIPLGSEFPVNTYTTNDQTEQAIAVDADGDFVITWRSDRQSAEVEEIYARRYHKDGTPLGDEFRVNTTTTDAQLWPDIAINADGGFVITWTSNGQDGSGFGIFGQRYSKTGLPLGSEFPVNTFTNNSQRESAIAMSPSGDFVVAWASSLQDGSENGVFAQRYSSTGAKKGGEFRLNTYTTSRQWDPDIAMDATGNFVAVWESVNQDGDSYGIFAQRFNAVGVPRGNEFKVNTYTTSAQRNAAIAIDADGDFVVAWESFGQGSSSSDIFAQRYKSNGEKRGKEFRVNTSTTNEQTDAAIGMDTNGNFVITWTGQSESGPTDVYGQRFSSTGKRIGGEFLINTYTSSSQDSSAIGLDADGDFVTAWNSLGAQDGSLSGVYGQRFSLPSQVRFAKSRYSVNEGDGSVKLTLTRTNTLLGATVEVSVIGGTATKKDYNGSSFPLEVSFDVGEKAKKFSIPIKQDTRFEKTETIALGLKVIGNAELGTPSKTKIKILDDSRYQPFPARASKQNDELLGNHHPVPPLPNNDLSNSEPPKLQLRGTNKADVFELSCEVFTVIRNFEDGDDFLKFSRGTPFKHLGIVQQESHTLIEYDENIVAKLRHTDSPMLTKSDLISL